MTLQHAHWKCNTQFCKYRSNYYHLRPQFWTASHYTHVLQTATVFNARPGFLTAEEPNRSNSAEIRCDVSDNGPQLGSSAERAPVKTKQTTTHNILQAFLLFNILSTSTSMTTMSQQQPSKKLLLPPRKKYKPIHLKVKSVIRHLPDKFQIIWKIIGDPLKMLLVISTMSTLPLVQQDNICKSTRNCLTSLIQDFYYQTNTNYSITLWFSTRMLSLGKYQNKDTFENIFSHQLTCYHGWNKTSLYHQEYTKKSAKLSKRK